MSTSTRPIGWGGPAAILGVALPLATQVLLPIWQFPATTMPGSEVVAWVGDHHGALVATIVLDGFGVMLWTVFGADLWSRLRRAAPVSALPTVFGVGLVGFTTLLLAGFTAAGLLVGQTPRPAVAGFAYDLCFGLLAMSGLPTAVAMAAFVTLAAQRRLFRPVNLALAVATEIAHLVLIASIFVRTGPLALEGPPITVAPAFLFAWIMATGTSLLRRDLRARRTAAPSMSRMA